MTTDEKLQAKLEELEFLTASSRALNDTLDLDQLLDVIMRLLKRALKARVVSLLLLDDTGKNLVFEIARGRRDSALRGKRIPVGEGIIGWVAKHGKPTIVNDVLKDPRYSKKLEKTLGVKPRSILAAPLKRRGRLVGVIDAIHRKPDQPFTEDDLQMAMALGEHIAIAIANARLYQRAERRGLEYSLLAKASADLGKRLELDEVLERIVHHLERLIPFDAIAIFLMNREEKFLDAVLHRGYPRGAAARIGVKSNEGLVGQAARRRRSAIIDDVREDELYVDARRKTRTEMIAPLVARGEVVGVFNLESDDVAAYRPEQLSLLEAFAAQAAVAIERAHLYDEQRIKKEIEDELEIARTVQAFFTPQKSRTVGKYRISGVSFPSLEVSGDYHDYFPLESGRMVFAIADVAGKGVPASLIMSSFRAILHTAAHDYVTARQITERANHILLETVRPQDFVTAFIGVLDPPTGEVTYCNSGHNPPILMAPDGDYRLLEAGGPVLGVFDDLPLVEGRFRLGDEVLLCYTDGATESRNDADEEYGEERLIGALHEYLSLTPYRLGRALHGRLQAFRGGASPDDDETYLAVRRTVPR